MVFFCCVPKCNNSGYDPGISMHKIPTDTKLRKVGLLYFVIYFCCNLLVNIALQNDGFVAKCSLMHKHLKTTT